MMRHLLKESCCRHSSRFYCRRHHPGHPPLWCHNRLGLAQCHKLDGVPLIADGPASATTCPPELELLALAVHAPAKRGICSPAESGGVLRAATLQQVFDGRRRAQRRREGLGLGEDESDGEQRAEDGDQGQLCPQRHLLACLVAIPIDRVRQERSHIPQHNDPREAHHKAERVCHVELLDLVTLALLFGGELGVLPRDDQPSDREQRERTRDRDLDGHHLHVEIANGEAAVCDDGVHQCDPCHPCQAPFE
mmetsp:Transcript_12969/g.33240  ORF Transcript_12969/g.33240 Transcript_12969/m.33240 type:complete len:250 (-) Transcript_12969:41-790(-)